MQRNATIARKRDESTHLGLGGTSPIFIHTPRGWPRDRAACRERDIYQSQCTERAEARLAAAGQSACRSNYTQAHWFINMSGRLCGGHYTVRRRIWSGADSWWFMWASLVIKPAAPIRNRLEEPAEPRQYYNTVFQREESVLALWAGAERKLNHTCKMDIVSSCFSARWNCNPSLFSTQRRNKSWLCWEQETTQGFWNWTQREKFTFSSIHWPSHLHSHTSTSSAVLFG